MKKINIKKIIMYIVIFFPITTVIQGIPVLGNINRVMMFLLLGFMMMGMYGKKTKIKNILISFITVILYICAIANTNKGVELNLNIYFYFLFWIIFFIYIKENYNLLMEFVREKYDIIFKVINVWSAIVIISLFFRSSYNVDGYFSPFGCGEHRFGSCCVMITTLIYIVASRVNKKSVTLYYILPIIGIGLSGARTYLAIYIVLILCIFYMNCKNKMIFYISLIPVLIFIMVLIKISPVGDKFVNTYTDGYNGMLATFTSGRSHFWKYDIEAFNELSILKKMIGNGFDFVYYINLTKVNLSIWAHNDFINVLMNFGYIGLILYLYVFFDFSLKILKEKNIKGIRKYSYFFIWLFNAMFNMVYTYIIATIAIPFILDIISDEKLFKLSKGDQL